MAGSAAGGVAVGATMMDRRRGCAELGTGKRSICALGVFLARELGEGGPAGAGEGALGGCWWGERAAAGDLSSDTRAAAAGSGDGAGEATPPLLRYTRQFATAFFP